MFNNKVVKGYADGTFKPSLPINRAEFTKIVVGSLYAGIVPDYRATSGPCENKFSDLVIGAWYGDFVCLAYIVKAIAGYSDGTFRPSANINFAEAAKITANSFKLPVTTDAKIWFKGYVDALAKLNAIPTSIYSFSQLITRGEMAEIFYRIKASVTTKATMSYSQLSP